MDREDAQLATVRALNAEARQELENHPSSDEILDYHEQVLSDDATESLRDHLAICPDCAQRALDLSVLVRPGLVLEEEDPPVGSAATEWQELEQALDQKDAPAGMETAAVTSFPKAKRTIFSSLFFAYATAALFFLTSLGLSVRLGVGSMKPRGPQAGPRLTDLQPAEVTQRDGTIVPAAPIEARMDNVVILVVSSVDSTKLDLQPDGYPARVGYHAKILDLQRAERPVVVAIDDLELIESNCTIEIPRGSLKAGSYGIQLYTADGDLLSEYELQVKDSSPAY